jgi:hypothetical protein
MRYALYLGGLLLACSAAWPADQGGDAHGEPQPHPIVGKPATGGAPKPGNPRTPKRPIGPPLSNPASPVARLYRASPEERDRALEKLPPKMQEQLRIQLERFDAMPKEQQQVFIRRAERFAAFSPEQKMAVARQLQALNKLSQDRHRAINRALRELAPMSEEERHAAVASEEFKARFSPEEQTIIADLAEVMLPPM